MTSNWELILRLVLAALLGGLIGFERERLLWAAGLRTHMLVSVGSALVMIVSAFGFTEVLGPEVALDPSRMAAQVVSGIGFLGAGSILLRGEIIRGLTTAASLWSVAAVGLAAGGGLYTVAIAATVIHLSILAGLKPFEKRLRANRQQFELQVVAEHGELSLTVLQQALGPSAARVKQFIVQYNERSNKDEVTIILSRISPGEFSLIQHALQELPCVYEVQSGDSSESS